MASSITKAIRLSVQVLSPTASRMSSTITKTGLSDTTTPTVADQKARLSTVVTFLEYSLVDDSKDNISKSDVLEMLPKFLFPEEGTNYQKEILKEAMKDVGFKSKVDWDGVIVPVNASGFDHKDLKVEYQDGYLLVQGETNDLMGKPLKVNTLICIPNSDVYDKEKLTTDSKNGLFKVVVPFLNKAKASN